MKTLRIGKHSVGQDCPPFVIAEIGINHNGDFETARRLIEEASLAGASAAKLQTYKTEKRVAAGSPIYGILKKCELSYEQQAELIKHGRTLGIEVFSTPFDEEAVEFLAASGVACFKIASFDVVNLKLLAAVARHGKPVVLSRGMATEDELGRAVQVLVKCAAPTVLLHCVSAYPLARHQDWNLSMIRALSDRYGCPSGFSDHTIGVEAPVMAVYAGAHAIEKHFTLSKSQEGPDHAMSSDPAEFALMVNGIRRAHEGLGKPVSGPVESERDIVQYRRPTHA